ncbi:hypothetical protein GPDM_02515 [Planococcus donghaensis MPA1U2]|uniref:Uncharacterized protein n=1 Tax=Planococcus donghaensis MPA1U2 TaxID=933115 RepID=E7RDH5_9BACL|nr:hypothetical protein GPDM_02515 [Planococcus donghaensis MPA1U2]
MKLPIDNKGIFLLGGIAPDATYSREQKNSIAFFGRKFRGRN